MPNLNPPRLAVTRRSLRRRGFTLAELLIVIGIIALLVSILIPTVRSVRLAAQETSTRAFIRALDAAAESYNQTYGSYPGTLPETMLGDSPAQNLNVVNFGGTGYVTNRLDSVTSSENFFVSIMGGLRTDTSGNVRRIVYDASRVGQGPLHLGLGTGKPNPAFFDGDAAEVSSLHVVQNLDVAWGAASSGDQSSGLRSGRFVDHSTAAGDSVIPEFVDNFSIPMPILYLRANNTTAGSPVASDGVANSATAGTYRLGGITAYTGQHSNGANSNVYIGEGRDELFDYHDANGRYHGLQAADDSDSANGFSSANLTAGTVTLNGQNVQTFQGPMDAVPFLTDPSTGNTPLGGKGRFLLISAGRDRVFGTLDDIMNVER